MRSSKFMKVPLCLLAGASATSTASASASSTSAASGLPHSIYDGTFTSSPRDDDLLHAIQSCDNSVACAGISLAQNGTVESHTIYEHSFVGPYRTPKTHETNKPYTYHRGQITGGEVISVETGLTLRDAKVHCTSDPECVGFTYPVYSLTGLNYLPNVTFVSTLTSFEPSPTDEYRSYVSNDVERASKVDGDALPYDEDVHKRPYRACCNKQDIPTMAEIEAADTVMERISCDISREEFFLKYEVPRKPVMLVGCEEYGNWSARTEWTYDKLAPRFSNSSQWRARFGGETEDYNKLKWEKIANAMRENKPFYVFDQLKDREAKSIEDDFEDPIPMKGGNMYAEMNRRGIFWAGPLRWFCLGKFGSGTRSHVDPFVSDAWNTLIKGHKWWVIYPPGVKAKQTFCESGCTDKTLVRPWYASVGINAARTEYPNDQYPYHVLQKPGETIYVPDFYVHSVFNMDSTIAITRNYGSAANLDKVWEEVCTSGDDRKWKIMYNLVLNKEQRRRVRNSKFGWPFEQHCVEEKVKETPAGKSKGKNLPEEPEEIEDYLYHKDWTPKIGDVVEARYKNKYNEWYKGTVSRASADANNGEGSYEVIYDDGDVERDLPRVALRKFITPRRGEIIRAKSITKKGKEVWTVGVVTAVRPDGTVDVTHHDKERYEALPMFFISRFDWAYPKNARIEAIWTDGKWYKAYVTKVRNDGTYDVEFDDGDEMDRLDHRRIRFLWARPPKRR